MVADKVVDKGQRLGTGRTEHFLHDFIQIKQIKRLFEKNIWVSITSSIDIDIHTICQLILYESTYYLSHLRLPLLPEMHEICMRWGLNTLYLSEARV